MGLGHKIAMAAAGAWLIAAATPAVACMHPRFTRAVAIATVAETYFPNATVLDGTVHHLFGKDGFAGSRVVVKRIWRGEEKPFFDIVTMTSCDGDLRFVKEGETIRVAVFKTFYGYVVRQPIEEPQYVKLLNESVE